MCFVSLRLPHVHHNNPTTAQSLPVMVAINGHELLSRAAGMLRDRYNRCLAKLSHGRPVTLGPSSSSVHMNLKKPSSKMAPMAPKATIRQTPKGRKQDRVQRKRYNKLAKDNSTVFMPGGFRNDSLERQVHHRPRCDLQDYHEPGGCDFKVEEFLAGQSSYKPTNEHEAFVMKQLESLMFDKHKRESQFHVKEVSERVKRQAPERKARMMKEDMEAKRLQRMEELERHEEKSRADRWKDQRLAQLEREKQAAESELAHEKIERKQSKLRRLFQEQEQRHREEERWRQLREREARLAAEREANLLRENALLEKGLRATDNAFRRACNEREYMMREKEEERARRLRAEESLHRWKELMREYFPGGQQQQHPGQQQQQQQQQQSEQSLRTQFELYEKKWEVLRSGVDIDGTKVHLISFSQIPWPVINITPTDPSQIRPEHIQEFLKHPLREKLDPRGNRKNTRSKARDELLRWHSDRFDKVVLSKVCEEDKPAVSEAVGMIICVLTEMRN